MAHLEIQQMEMALHDGDESAIHLHIEACPSCREDFEPLRKFYFYLDEFLNDEPTERDLIEAEKILMIRG